MKNAVNAMVSASCTVSAPGAENKPLWLRVAQWCLSQKTPVSREAIARAFALSARQAADIMLYITARRSDLVESRRAVKVLGGGMRVATLQVLAVHNAALPPRGARAHRRARRVSVVGEIAGRGQPGGGV